MADGVMTGAVVTDVAAVPQDAARALLSAGKRMDERGWVPATSGNLSARIGPDRMAITRSGVHKGFLGERDIIAVDFDGRPLDSAMRSSAETLLHCQIYRLWSDVGAVLHGHSIAATALTLASPQARTIQFQGYEIVKAWNSAGTHEADVPLPVIDNDQDMHRLAGRIAPMLEAGQAPIGYVLRGHGVYVWGADVASALNRMEALEFLLATEIERRKLL